MAQQTAVEWLFEIWNSRQPFDKFIFDEQFEQAKQMEKEQIINAWRNGDNDSIYDFKELDELAEQYYKETYEKDNA